MTCGFVKFLKMKEKIIDASLHRSKNRFITITNIYELVNNLRVKISYITSTNYKITNPTSMKKVHSLRQKIV